MVIVQAVFSIPIVAGFRLGLALAACAACAAIHPRRDGAPPPQSYYAVTAEIALTRHQPESRPCSHTAAAANETDVGLLARATQVSAETCNPPLAQKRGALERIDPQSVDAARGGASGAGAAQDR